MNEFYLKKTGESEIKKELESIGFDGSYLDCASFKYRYINIKIYKLTLPQANILKQTALSAGADCAVNRGVLTANVQYTDCILGGSVSQIKQIIKKLNNQQFSMPELAKKIETFLQSEFSEKKDYEPQIVGILNVTKNSFSDGGMYYEYESAIKHLNDLIEDGSDVIDIGAESTKPYSSPVSAEEQLEKLEPVLKYIVKNNIKIPISVDTRSSEVARRVIDYGVSIINDVSGFDYDKNMCEVVKNSGVKVILQHSQGTPENMQDNPHYKNIIDDIFLNFCEKLNYGVKKENIILDVGIGFGKTKEQNFELIKRIDEFRSLGCKIMLGTSRKSFLNMPEASNEEKDIFTLAINTLAVERKVDYLRVHNVKLHKQLANLMKNFKEI